MKQKRNTLIFVLLLIVIIFISLLIQTFFFKRKGAKVIIEQHGQAVAELDLSHDLTYNVKDSDGGTNTIVIENGAVYVAEANCPDLICVHTGKISTTGVPIACLPHGLIVTIQDQDSTIDAQAY